MSETRDPGRLMVGMEVHLQLNTATKCFSASPYHFGADPNTLTDPTVMGLPGALPVLNREALRLAVRTGLAFGCEIAALTKWDRKNYFYPDLPKGYQISQFDKPLCTGGGIEIDDDEGNPKVIRLIRAHLEEDTGKSTHDEGGDKSRVDLNRAGAPLLEIVSEPDIASAAEAERYLDALREIVGYVGTSDGNMEEGNLRCEPNINLVFENGDKTPIVEVKNINSVRNVGLSIEAEVERQRAEYYDEGRTMANTPRSTRGWNDAQGATVHQRYKESADDYRYFPEPDLPPLEIARSFVATERAALPELPRARRRRYVEELGLSPYEAGVLTADPALSVWYEETLAGPTGRRDPKAVANWIQGELLRHLNEQKRRLCDLALSPAGLGELIDLQTAGTINARTAKELFREVIESGASPAALVAERGLGQVSDRAPVEAAVEAALELHAQAAADFRAGNEKARGRIFGEVMKQLGGRGDPKLVNEVLKERLG
jgi:aspartyl-tRNA(Asn)/glutamyl-tRNA(Gln) amidotransferase subunit B